MKITRRRSRSAARLTAIAVLISVVAPVSAQQARPSQVERRDATGYAALAALESALGVSVPPSSFAPGGASVLPE